MSRYRASPTPAAAVPPSLLASTLPLIAGLIALALIDLVNETVGATLALTNVDKGPLEVGAKAQVVMLIVFPMGFAFSLLNVAANAALNERVPLPIPGRIVALLTVVAGVAAAPPLLAAGALTQVIDVPVVLGLAPVLPLAAWGWARWGRQGRFTARHKRLVRRHGG